MVQLQAARASQDRLLADAAHELRTPLTLMRTSLDLALRKERSVEELRTAVSEARTEVDRLAVLASRLLELGAAGRSWTPPSSTCSRCSTNRPKPRGPKPNNAARGSKCRGRGPRLRGFQPWRCDRPSTTWCRTRFGSRPWARPFAWPACRCPTVAGGSPSPTRGPAYRSPAQRSRALHRIDPRGGSGLGLAIVSEVMRLHGGRAFAAVPATGVGTEIVLELPPPAKNGVAPRAFTPGSRPAVQPFGEPLPFGAK